MKPRPVGPVRPGGAARVVRLARAVFMAVAVMTGSACDLFGPSGPGVMEITLRSEDPLGALVLDVRGPGITGVESLGTTRAYGAKLSGPDGRLRVVLVNAASGNFQFGLRTDDLGAQEPEVIVAGAVDTLNRTVPLPSVEMSIRR